MANTLGNFDVEQLLQSGLQILGPAIPSCTSYCTPLRLSGPVVAGDVAVPLISAVGSVQSNPGSFEQSTDTVQNAGGTLEMLSAQFGFSQPEQHSGLTLKMLLDSHLTAIQQAIQIRINAVINETNFGEPVLTTAALDMDATDFDLLVQSVPGRRGIILTPAYWTPVKQEFLPAGYTGRCDEISEVGGLGDGVVGWAGRPEAIAVVYGFPGAPPRADVVQREISLPIGIPVMLSYWFSRPGRSLRGSLDVCLAVSPGQAGALKVVTDGSEDAP